MVTVTVLADLLAQPHPTWRIRGHVHGRVLSAFACSKPHPSLTVWPKACFPQEMFSGFFHASRDLVSHRALLLPAAAALTLSLTLDTLNSFQPQGLCTCLSLWNVLPPEPCLGPVFLTQGTGLRPSLLIFSRTSSTHPPLLLLTWP